MPGPRVALLAEGVDRNILEALSRREGGASPSSRRAWIEIPKRSMRRAGPAVALLAEGVDRNRVDAVAVADDGCRPPRGGRG